MLILNNISKNYGKKRKKRCCFQGVNLEFSPSSFSVITGEKGAGKTTLINIIAGIDSPDEGEVNFNTTIINEKNKDEYRRKYVGYIGQERLVDDQFSIDDLFKSTFMMIGKEFSKDNLIKALLELNLFDNKEEIEIIITKDSKDLNKSQKLKIEIACAMLKNPAILILDEPFISIEEKEKQTLLSYLKRNIKNRIIIASSEDNTSFQEITNQEIALKDQSVVITKKYSQNNEKDSSTYKSNSKIQYKNTLHTAFHRLRKNRALMVLSMIFCLITTLIFSFTFNIFTCDTNSVNLKTQLKNGSIDCFLYFETGYWDHGSEFMQTKRYSISKEQQKRIETYTEGKCAPYYNLGLNLAMLPANRVHTSWTYKFLNMNSFVEVNPSTGTKDLSLTRYESLNHETTCRLPETLEEVAISDLAAETFKECGLVEERSDKGDEISVFYPEKVDDLIGRKLYNGLVITGIYTTIDRPLDYWGQYLTKTTPIAEGEEKDPLLNYYRNGRSLSQCFFLKEGYHELLHNPSYFSGPNAYYVILHGKYREDMAFINSFNQGLKYVSLRNKYSAYTREYSHETMIKTWAIIFIPLLINYFLTAFYFSINHKKFSKETMALREMGASKNFIGFISFLQSGIMNTIVFVITFLMMFILGSVLNSMSITPYYTPTILTIFIMVVMHLIVSLSIFNRTKKKIR